MLGRNWYLFKWNHGSYLTFRSTEAGRQLLAWRWNLWVSSVRIQCAVRSWPTWNEVSKAHGGESDDYKVDGLQEGPPLHLLEHQRGHHQEDQAANQDGDHRRTHANYGGTEVALLQPNREDERFSSTTAVHSAVKTNQGSHWTSKCRTHHYSKWF